MITALPSFFRIFRSEPSRTVLLRNWHGTEHRVIVREQGVEFQGKQYHSLSQAGHRITGSKWSGRLFFGLKGKAQEHADG